MEHACSCSICGEQSHLTRKCPELVYATPGGGGGGGHDHDDDDERLALNLGTLPDDGSGRVTLHPPTNGGVHVVCGISTVVQRSP